MKLWNYFFAKDEQEYEQVKSADVVKDRLLQLVIAYESSIPSKSTLDLEEFQDALRDFICNYIHLHEDEINVTLHKRDTQSILEMSVAIPEKCIKEQE